MSDNSQERQPILQKEISRRGLLRAVKEYAPVVAIGGAALLLGAGGVELSKRLSDDSRVPTSEELASFNNIIGQYIKTEGDPRFWAKLQGMASSGFNIKEHFDIYRPDNMGGLDSGTFMWYWADGNKGVREQSGGHGYKVSSWDPGFGVYESGTSLSPDIPRVLSMEIQLGPTGRIEDNAMLKGKHTEEEMKANFGLHFKEPEVLKNAQWQQAKKGFGDPEFTRQAVDDRGYSYKGRTVPGHGFMALEVQYPKGDNSLRFFPAR